MILKRSVYCRVILAPSAFVALVFILSFNGVCLFSLGMVVVLNTLIEIYSNSDLLLFSPGWAEHRKIIRLSRERLLPLIILMWFNRNGCNEFDIFSSTLLLQSVLGCNMTALLPHLQTRMQACSRGQGLMLYLWLWGLKATPPDNSHHSRQERASLTAVIPPFSSVYLLVVQLTVS